MKKTLRVLLFLWTTPLLAHDTWILPVRWQVEAGDRLTVLLTSAMSFPAAETAVKPDRLLERSVRLARATDPLEPALDEKVLALSAPVARRGIATVWITTRERSLELTPGQVREYLEEIGAADTIGKDWRDSGKTIWRETYVKVAKTFVRVGDAADRSSPLDETNGGMGQRLHHDHAGREAALATFRPIF